MSQSGSYTSGGSSTPGYLVLSYTYVDTTPYVVLSTDSFLGVDSSVGGITIELPNAPAIGRVFVIKDIGALASTNNIIVTTVSGAVLIDGSTAIIMNSDNESLQFLFDGTQYFIF